ncbi:Hpt domain-containing protein [Sinomonas mesophila]|uniref:Hpt domain-containing protein n=1 Tax=Sinomonas mesophila TaxID=1531955 RepID=UPI00111551E9|nr:Hpt domain-containing protein [Sinomonas mesophila]
MTASGNEDTARGGPLLDDGVLRELAEDVGPRAATSFAREFAGMWPRRRAALATAVSRGDVEGAMDAILSVRVSSAMVGARRLEGLAAGLETGLRTGGVRALRPLLRDVERCGDDTARALVDAAELG